MSQTTSLPKIGVIPAAGKGTRFLPSTKATPKEMHPLLNYPLIHHCLLELKNAGVEEAIIISHPDKKGLEKYFEDHSSFKKDLNDLNKPNLANELQKIEELPKVTFVYQTEQLGLAHAVLCAEDAIASRDFFLLLPDEIFIPKSLEQNPCVELLEVFKSTGKSSISLLEVDPKEVSNYGVAKTSLKDSHLFVEDLIEKPKQEEAPSNHILPGRYLFKNEILEIIKTTPEKNGEVQLTDSIVSLSKKDGVFGKVTSCLRFDGGSVIGFLKANIYQALQDNDLKGEMRSFLKNLVN